MSAITVAPRIRCKRPVVAKKPLRRIGDGVFRTIVEMAYEMDASERVCPVEYEEGMAWLKKNLPAVKKRIAGLVRQYNRRFKTEPRNQADFIYHTRLMLDNYSTDSFYDRTEGIVLHRHYHQSTPLYHAVSSHTIRVKLVGDVGFLIIKGTYWCSAMERGSDGVKKEIILPLSESCSVIERNVIKMLRSLNPFPHIVFP